MRQFSRRRFLAALLAGGPALMMSKSAAAQQERRANNPPNVVFILTDDLGWAELGCYGNAFNETPHLDKLARQGMRFTQAYAAASVCSPTRASLMTGQYPARVGITDYLRADDAKHLSPETHTTVARALAAQGYATGLIGKWHLMGDYEKRRGDPARHGFGEVVCSETRYIGGGDYFHPYNHLPDVEARWENEYLTDRLSAEAADFITRHKEEPFFLYVSYYSVHTRLAGRPPLIEKYQVKPGAGKNKNNPVLAAMLESIDNGVGRMMHAIEQCGIADNTILVFMSDNGGEHKVTSNAPLRGGKSQLYEGGIRVPLIVRWPQAVAAGAVCDTPVSTIDFYPTFLDLAGVAPADGQPVDGESLAPLLKQTGPLERDTLFWHYPIEKPHFLGGRSSGVVRQGDLKLVEFYDTGEVELYDLAKDLGEQHNLAEKQPQKAAQLRQMLGKWRKRMRAGP